MFFRVFHTRQAVRTGIILATVILLLVGAGAAYATFAPLINTDDTLIDPSWAAPLYDNSACAKAVPLVDQIKFAWYQNNDTNLMVRMEFCGAPALTSNNLAVLALDCDRNGTTSSMYDRLITYNPVNDYVDIKDGTGFSFQSPDNCGSPPPASCAFGERINPDQGSGNTVEYRINFSTFPDQGSPLPLGCRDGINIPTPTPANPTVPYGEGVSVGFAVVRTSDKAIIDQTPLTPWNIPTLVQMKEISASNLSSLTPLTLGVLGALLVGGLGVAVIYRRRRP
jgi:hypothetical protein